MSRTPGLLLSAIKLESSYFHLGSLILENVLGVEKSGRNAEGDSWWETWQEMLHQDEWRWEFSALMPTDLEFSPSTS